MAGLKRSFTKMAKQIAELKETQKKHLTFMKNMKVGIDSTFSAQGVRTASIDRRVTEIEDYYKEDDGAHATQAAQPVTTKKVSGDLGI